MTQQVPEKEKKTRAVVWVSENAPTSRTIVICSTEADARRVHRITALGTVALTAVPGNAEERLVGRHVVLALRPGLACDRITLGLNRLSDGFGSYRCYAWPSLETDDEIRSSFKWITDPFNYAKLPIFPTATGLVVNVTTAAQQEALEGFVKAHPGRFPLHINDRIDGTRRIVRIKETYDALWFVVHWFGKRAAFYERASWAFGI